MASRIYETRLANYRRPSGDSFLAPTQDDLGCWRNATTEHEIRGASKRINIVCVGAGHRVTPLTMMYLHAIRDGQVIVQFVSPFAQAENLVL
jgi:hypothetical protein